MSNYKWASFFVLSILFFALKAETPQRLFQKANEAYQQKAYTKAIGHYEALVEQGVTSKEIHYNLGNAYYRSQQLGKAILNYERALRLSPNDEDVLHNLEVASFDKKDDFGEIPEFFMTRAWEWTSQLLASRWWSILSILLVWLGIGGFVTWLMSKERAQKKQGFLIGTVALLLSIIPFFLAKTSARLALNSGQAIVTQKTTKIHTNADDSSAILYQLHEGTKVKLLDELSKWKKVRLSNGEQGWIPEEALEQI